MMSKRLTEEDVDCSSMNPPDYCSTSNSGFLVFMFFSLFMYVSPYIFIGICKFIKSYSHDNNIRIEENNHTHPGRDNRFANGINNNDNDIILLPKYQSTQELNDDEINCTLPPSYENIISTN